MSNPLHEMSLADVGALIRSKRVSPVEVTTEALARIEQLNPRVNAFWTVTADLAREQARAAETEIVKGEYRGPLHGVPIGLKDLFYTRGIRTTAGSKIMADFVPDFDATVVERLRQAGAVLVGKTALHEFAYGVTNDNPHFGPTRNPWDPTRTPGGSSGGSGVALATGMCYAALGTDTGGSIRIPACFCGIAGLKPTRGRVSVRGVYPLGYTLDHVGPMARTVVDVGLVYQVIAGFDPQDEFSEDRPVGEVRLRKSLNQGTGNWEQGTGGRSQNPSRESEPRSATPVGTGPQWRGPSDPRPNQSRDRQGAVALNQSRDRERAATQGIGNREQGTGGRNPVRIGLPENYFFDCVQPEVETLVRKAASVMEDLGAELVPVRVPGMEELEQANLRTLLVEAYVVHKEHLENRPNDLGEEVRKRIERGREVSAPEYVEAQLARHRIRRELEQLFEQVDVIVTPTTPLAAFPLGETKANVCGKEEDARIAATRLTRVFNATGHPALSVCCGFTSQGLPAGLQIVGRMWGEATVLQVGYAYEQATDWHTRRPPV